MVSASLLSCAVYTVHQQLKHCETDTKKLLIQAPLQLKIKIWLTIDCTFSDYFLTDSILKKLFIVMKVSPYKSLYA